MTTITRIYPDATETTTPELVDGYSATRTTGNVIIPILGGGIAVTMRPAQPRSGTLRLFYPDEADAAAAAAMHALVGTFTLTSDERDSIEMTFATSGQITIELDDETRDLWVVSVDYQELS
jgi:hypothetical protein